MLSKLKLFLSVLLIILVSVFYHASAIADDNSGNAQAVVNAVAQAVAQATASSDDETASSDEDDNDSPADDADDSDDQGVNPADIQQTADDVREAADAVSKAIDAFKAQDYPTAVKYFKMGAYKYHDARAQNDLAKFYANGLGTDQNYSEALKLFHTAAAHSDGKIKADAESSVGIMYAKGMGVKQNPKKALHWLHKSSVHGNHEAKENLAILKRPGSSFKVKVARIHTDSIRMGNTHNKKSR